MAPRTATVRMLALVTVIVTCAVAVFTAGLPDPAGLAATVDGLGAFGPVVAVLASAALLAALVPRSVLAAGAGLVFGPLAGSGYVLAGALLAGLLAFLAGRVLGREFVAARTRLATLDSWLTDRGVLGVVILRILPVAPFGLVSYGFGTTGIRTGSYLLGTAIGAAPSTVAYATLGESALEPGSAGFAVSLAAVALLAAGGAAGAAFVRRRSVPVAPS
jgi:uncharacterized membrane protein YdjX (TVP38/TMEM64 family)